MGKYIAEILGTFALVFCGTGAIIINQETGGSVTNVGIAITFGLIVMVMIHTLGDISGAHLNPAVTIAFMFSRAFSIRKVLPYIMCQVAGALVASLLLKFLFPHNLSLGATIPSGTMLQSFIIEFILTFFLMLVILSVATRGKEKGILASVAVGATVLLEAMFAGPISGASMNPARSLAPAFVSAHIEYLWLYIVAPVAGASFAVPIWRLLNLKATK